MRLAKIDIHTNPGGAVGCSAWLDLLMREVALKELPHDVAFFRSVGPLYNPVADLAFRFRDAVASLYTGQSFGLVTKAAVYTTIRDALNLNQHLLKISLTLMLLRLGEMQPYEKSVAPR